MSVNNTGSSTSHTMPMSILPFSPLVFCLMGLCFWSYSKFREVPKNQIGPAVFTGKMISLTPNQQYQNTEVISTNYIQCENITKV